MVIVVQVVAMDSDAGANGTVRYSARARGGARGLLRVHAASGRLLAAPRLPLAPEHTYDLTVSSACTQLQIHTITTVVASCG